MNYITDLWAQSLAAVPMAQPTYMDVGGGYVWVGSNTAPGCLARVDPNNPAAFQYAPALFDGRHNAIADGFYHSATGKVYVLFKNTGVAGCGTVVSAVDPTALTYTDLVSTYAYDTGQGSMCTDGTYLYIATCIFGVQANLLKYDLTTGAFVAALPIAFGGQVLRAAGNCRYDGANVYVSSYETDLVTYLAFVKIDLSTFTVAAGASLPSNTNVTLADDSAFTANYIWYGSEVTGNLIRVAKASLTTQTVITTGFGAACYGVYYDGAYILACSDTSPGVVARIDPTTLAVTLYQFTGSGENIPNEIWADSSNVYFTFFTSSGMVSATSRSTFGEFSVADPTLSPGAGFYSSTQSVSITTSTPSTTIRYTTDGSTPSDSHGTVYTVPVVVAASETIKAVAYLSGWTDSAVVSAAYTITPPPPSGTAARSNTLAGTGPTLITKGTSAPMRVSSPAAIRRLGQDGTLPTGTAEAIAKDFEGLAKSVNSVQQALATTPPAIDSLTLQNPAGQTVASVGDMTFNGVPATNYFSELHVGNPLGTNNPKMALFNANKDGSVVIGQNGYLDVLDPFGNAAAWLGTQNDTLPVTGAADNGSGLIRLTVTGHTLSTGNSCQVLAVGGVPNATGIRTVTAIDANTVDLQATVFAGTYTGGGTIDRVLQVTGAANNGSGLIRLTLTAHGYTTADQVNVAAVGGVSNATGQWLVTVYDANHVDLQGSTWAGAFTSGGTCLRYFTGMLAQTISIGLSFLNWKLRAFADGSLQIQNADIILSSANGTITMDPTVPSITINALSAGVVTASIVISAAKPSIVFTSYSGTSITSQIVMDGSIPAASFINYGGGYPTPVGSIVMNAAIPSIATTGTGKIVTPNYVSVSIAGKPGGGATVANQVFTRTITFPADFSGSAGTVGTNPTATAVFAVTGGSVGGSVSIDSSGNFTFSTVGGVAMVFTSGQGMTITAPSVPDLTLADVSFTLDGSG